MTDRSLAEDLHFSRILADTADAISLHRFRASDLVVDMKPDMTHVTDADRAVETALRQALSTGRPDDALMGEEFGDEGDARRRWIIDPIDGTANYVRGVPVWATLIALVVDGTPVLGVVSAPALGRRWWAAKGLGAFASESVGGMLTERRIRVSRVGDLADASMSCSDVKRWEAAGKLEQFLGLTRSVWRTRDYGDMWPYMMVAEGLVDLAGEYDLKPWDMAALVPIVEEAGGRFTSAEGEAGPWHGSAIATNGLLHDAVLEALR